MSIYIVRDDYLTKIRDNRLTQLTQDTPSILDDAEDAAIQVVKDSLHSRYDIAVIFAKTKPNRDKQVVRWVCNLVLYYIHERLPDKLIPESVITNYDETIEYLKAIEDGKRSTQLPRLTNSEGEKPTKVRWGSYPPRSH